MKINDVYEMSVKQESFDVFSKMKDSALFLELNIHNPKTIQNIKTKNNLIKVHIVNYAYKSFLYYQDTESWTVCYVTYTGLPFCVVRNLSREGDIFPGIFISDLNLYKLASAYLLGFVEEEADFSGERFLPLSGSLNKEIVVKNYTVYDRFLEDEVFTRAIQSCLVNSKYV